MIYMIILLILFMSLYFLYIDKKLISPAFSFSCLFALILAMNAFEVFSLYKAKESIYLLILLGVSSFLCGTCITRTWKFRIRKSASSSKREIVSINCQMYWGMFIVCLSILGPSIFMISSFLVSGNSIGDVYLIAARASHGEINELTQSSLNILLEQYIAYPLLYLLVPASITLFFHYYKKRYLMIAIILTCIRIVLNARRTYLLTFLMMLFTEYIMHKNDSYFSNMKYAMAMKKWKKRIVALIGIFVGVFVYITVQRYNAEGKIHNVNLLASFCYYYGGSLKYFEHSLEGYRESYTYGFSSLRGLFSPIFGVLKLLGIGAPRAYETATRVLNSMASNIIFISPDKTFNSFATAFYQFYCDGGILGIVFLSVLYGAYSHFLYRKWKDDRTVKSETQYVFWYTTVLMLSFVNMETVLSMCIWPIIISKLLFNKKCVKV